MEDIIIVKTDIDAETALRSVRFMQRRIYTHILIASAVVFFVGLILLFVSKALLVASIVLMAVGAITAAVVLTVRHIKTLRIKKFFVPVTNTYTIDENRVLVHSESSTGVRENSYSWNSLLKAESTDTAFYLYLGNSKVILVQKTNMPENDIDLLSELLSNKLGKNFR